MYNTGTVTTTANSTKLVGAGTKWLNNINRVSAEQAIQIQIGTTVHNNSIQSIQSDTELTLNFPLPAAATGAKYVILTTMVHSVSDAMNKIVSMNGANVQFSDILTRWMTEQGIITVTLPDQTTQQLRTTKEMDKQLDGKFDKALALSVTNSDVLWKGQHAFTQVGIGDAGMAGKRAWISLSGISLNPKGDGFYNIIWPEKSGMLMQVGDFGFGAGRKGNATDAVAIKNFNDADRTAVYKSDDLTENARFTYSPMLNMTRRGGADGTGFCSQIQVDSFTGVLSSRGGTSGGRFSGWMDAYSPANTTKDANGNLKAASPIIRVFADHVDPNEEAQGVTLKKLHTGIYQLHGTLGLHSDASWGGINGGITIPCGINQLPLVYALYDVLEKGKPHPFDGRIVEPDEDGDIVLYTSYRQHDLPQNIQYERFKLYPEFLRDATEDEESIPGFDGKVELTPGEPCDIPVGHWVDVRVNMPSNSIYNQKQAEAERLAKLEAERLAEEEAKRAAEEAERAEQEDQNEA
ncbi:TPA: hypothetical protein U2I32_003629 [Providencia rettgeri]|nr:hypothetical protein [Providencia rettgeri]